MAIFVRRPETYFGVSGVSFRVPTGGYSRELEVELGSIAQDLDVPIGGDPEGLMGLPGHSDSPELDQRREWGVWAPDHLARRLDDALSSHGHTLTDDPS